MDGANLELVSETKRPSAAFRRTALEKSLSSPLYILIILSALNLASSPNRFSNLSALMFNSIGSISISEILLSFNWIIFVFA